MKESDYTLDEVEEWASTRETSPEVAEAIFYIAADEEDADAILEDPSEDEVLTIYERATKTVDGDDLVWSGLSFDQMIE